MRCLLSPIIGLLFSFSTWAAVSIHNTGNLKCQLDGDQKIVIGCTNYCGKFNRWALKRYAKKLGYKVDVVNLRSDKQTVDYTLVDGILMPGGSDINPKRYIDQAPEDIRDYLESVRHLYDPSEIGEKRDAFEFDLLDKYYANERSRYQPILGICRGMQVLTVSQGIPLYVDIKTELGIKNRRYTLDKISVRNPESLIAQTVGKNSFRGVKFHHQGLRLDYFLSHQQRWPNLEVTATSNGGKIAEVLEFYDRPILGVQFHPEWTLFSSMRKDIFSWLLKRSCFNKIMGEKIFNEKLSRAAAR